MSEQIINRRGNAVSQEVFIPVGEQVLIKTVGVAPILEIFNGKDSINMTMNCFIVGVGDKVNMDAANIINAEEMYRLGDEVVVGSSDEFSFKPVIIPNAEKTISWYKKNESNPELIIANAVIRDKSKSKLALNNSDILAGNPIIDYSKMTKRELFVNKEVEVIAYYTTHMNNIIGVYDKPTKEAKEGSITN